MNDNLIIENLKKSLLKEVSEDGNILFDEFIDSITHVLKNSDYEKESYILFAYSLCLSTSLTLRVCHPEYEKSIQALKYVHDKIELKQPLSKEDIIKYKYNKEVQIPGYTQGYDAFCANENCIEIFCDNEHVFFLNDTLELLLLFEGATNVFSQKEELYKWIVEEVLINSINGRLPELIFTIYGLTERKQVEQNLFEKLS